MSEPVIPEREVQCPACGQGYVSSQYADELHAASAKVAELEAEIQGFREYKPDEIELENWSFQHFDFLDPDEKEALKILSNRARLAAELETKVAEQTEEIRLAREKYSQYRSEMTRDLAEQAATIDRQGNRILMQAREARQSVATLERMTNILTFLRKTFPEEYWDSNELTQIDKVLDKDII